MKKNFFYVAIVPLLLFSCNNEDLGEIQNADNVPESGIVTIPSKSFYYDGIYEIRDGKEVDLTDLQYINTPNSLTRATTTHQFYDISTINPNYIYLGSVLSAQSINEGLYVPAGYTNILKDSITVSFTLPVPSKKIAPRKSEFTNAIIGAIGNRNFSGQQSQVFSYKMKQFSSYSEVKLAFGANVNIGQLFSINTQVNSDRIQKSSALFVDFSQIYFTADMDIPDDGNIYKTEAIRQQYLSQNPVYINSVNYGRKGIILVESNETYNALSVAVRAAFNAGKVGVSLDLDVNTKRILENAEISICILGGDAYDAVRTVKGFAEFQEFIINGGVYTTEVYGVPISFGGAYASNNGMFATQFQITQ